MSFSFLNKNMWMMGCNDGGDFSMSDPFSSRKLRPLIPIPVSSTSTMNPPCLSRVHGGEFFSLNHHLANVGEQNKREFDSQPVVTSSRWNPTPEQLRTLEELYRRGTRTPSADQIQHITAQLRRYGKIEGKNVFYWFQNHKARERQKRRRQMESNGDTECLQEKKDSGTNKTGFEVEHTKNWPPSSNCSTLIEESISIQRASKAAVTECNTDGWLQFEEGELQQRRGLMERNSTWPLMQLSCHLPHHPTHLIKTTAAAATMDPKLIKRTHDLNIFTSDQNGPKSADDVVRHTDINGYGESESQTLQLFPLRSCDGDRDDARRIEAEETPVSAMNGISLEPPQQFYEFLPLKN